MTTILATVDGSPESGAVLPVLQNVAKAMNATVRLLTVVKPAEATYGQPSRPTPGLGEARAVGPGVSDPNLSRGGGMSDPRHGESRDQAIARVEHVTMEALETVAKPLRDAGIMVVPDVVMDDDVVEAIVRVAREHKVDLIAMSTHGRSGLSALVQGSVAASVLRTGIAPMLLVRPTQT